MSEGCGRGLDLSVFFFFFGSGPGRGIRGSGRGVDQWLHLVRMVDDVLRLSEMKRFLQVERLTVHTVGTKRQNCEFRVFPPSSFSSSSSVFTSD